jgi:hypothetical protein
MAVHGAGRHIDATVSAETMAPSRSHLSTLNCPTALLGSCRYRDHHDSMRRTSPQFGRHLLPQLPDLAHEALMDPDKSRGGGAGWRLHNRF